MTFEIRRQDCTGEIVARVRAENYTTAGHRAARKLFGRTVTGYRVTGDDGMSGCFRAYRPAGQGTLSSTGYQFHIRQAD